MKMNYNGKDYELVEFTEPNKRTSFDIIGIMEYSYFKWVGDHNDDLQPVDKEEWDSLRNVEKFDEYTMVGYFYGSDEEDADLIEKAKKYIDRLENERRS